jgi:hypothetical protein
MIGRNRVACSFVDRKADGWHLGQHFEQRNDLYGSTAVVRHFQKHEADLNPLCRITHLDDPLKLRQQFGVVAGEMMDNAHIVYQATKVSGRQNKIQMIATVALFDHTKLAVNVGRLALHMVKLLVT